MKTSFGSFLVSYIEVSLGNSWHLSDLEKRDRTGTLEVDVLRSLVQLQKWCSFALSSPVEDGSCRRGQTQFVPATNPSCLLVLHSGSPICPWIKLSKGDVKVHMSKLVCIFR